MSDLASVDLARSMRIVEIISDLENHLSWIASVQTSPLVQYHNDACDIVLQQCKAEANQLLCEPFKTLDTSIRTQDRHRAQLRWYVFHDCHAFTHCKVDFVTKTDIFTRILTDATVRRYRAYRLQLRMEVLLQWAASRRAVLHDRDSQSFDVTRLHRIDSHLQTVSRRRRTKDTTGPQPIEHRCHFDMGCFADTLRVGTGTIE